MDTFYSGWLIANSLTADNDVQNIWVESDAGGGGINGANYSTELTATVAGHLGSSGL